ncbi:acyl-CoA dehydrogenase family protein [Streptomyces sp. HSW2009]|uniref:acyl-CoA dehydrogenase family protein n=1 Tax=Streptomyces sp. HSW2009 TaxID=3142890 RepID=UPI0032EF6350
MDLALTAAQEEFRSRVCALLTDQETQAEADRDRRLPPGAEPGLPTVYRRLGERGWLAPNWAREHGGAGLTLVEKALLTEELIAHGVPDVAHTLSVDIVGLAVHLFGTAEQQTALLPPLARGEQIGCVLFSEPETGSDLGSLTTRAEPEGEGWRLYGRKTYSLKSHLGDFALCAARTTTSPVRYHGITVFVLPLRTPGVDRRPLPVMTDDKFAELTLTGPLMTRADVLGEVDDGWRVINRVLSLERTGIEFEAKGRRLVDALLAHAEAAGPQSPYAERLVALDAEVRAGRLLAWRALSLLTGGDHDDPLYAMAKWHTAESARAAALLSSSVCGPDAALHARDAESPAGWTVESSFRDAPGYTLASGTSEMMLALIASGALSLPT